MHGSFNDGSGLSGPLREGYDPETARIAEQMIAAERELLAARKDALEECDCRKGMFPNPAAAPTPSRRGMLFAAGSIAGAAFATRVNQASAEAVKPPPGAVARKVPVDPTKEPGAIGRRRRLRNHLPVRDRGPFAFSDCHGDQLMDVQSPRQEPRDDHAVGSAFRASPRRHSNDRSEQAYAAGHGMVERPKKFSVADIKRFPSMTRTCFIECSGNGLTEWKVPTLKTVQGTHGLLSNTEWTGVRFATIAREIGLKPARNGCWQRARTVPHDALDPAREAIVRRLYRLWANGEALRPEQGYPLRLVLPGWEGNTMIKWLRRLEISDKPFMTREETSKYTDLMKDGTARQFSFTMEAKSVITFPSGEMKLPGPGFYEVTGLAWTGRGKVERVEVSTDGGKTWALAALQDPIVPLATTRFRFPWVWDGKPAVLQSRCTDETGYIQPTLKHLVDIRGANGKFGSFYHLNAIFSWGVAADGSVTNVQV